MSRARFRVTGRLDRIGGPIQEGTVTIDRHQGTFSVRPLRRRRDYMLPLSDVACMVVCQVVHAEIQQARRERAERRARRAR